MKRTELARTVSLSRRSPLARAAVRAHRQPATLPEGGREPAQRARGATKARPATADTRETVQARSGGRCEIGAVGCLGRATNMHHRLPKRMGGSRNPALETAANLLHVCGQGNTSGCHRFVDEHSRIAAVAGWKLHAGADPTAEPVRYRCRSLCWLTEDGKRVGELS